MFTWDMDERSRQTWQLGDFFFPSHIPSIIKYTHNLVMVYATKQIHQSYNKQVVKLNPQLGHVPFCIIHN